MIHSKLHQILAAAALALCGAGCALETPGEPTSTSTEQSTEQSQSDLKKASTLPVQNGVVAGGLSDEAPAGNSLATPPSVVHIIKTDKVLGNGGETDDGPRPHPWEPNPEDGSNNTGGGTGSGSSPTK